MSPPRRRNRPTPKPKPVRRKPTINAQDVALREGKGSAGAGGDPGGSYWHILLEDARVGRVFINLIDEAPQGLHPSIQIFVNKDQQGRGIGSAVYRKACEASGHDVVYAHMRRSNLPSRRAAEIAGFEVVDDPDDRQLTMVWRRP